MKSVLHLREAVCTCISNSLGVLARICGKIDTLFNIYDHCVQHLTLGFMPHPFPGASVRVTVMIS